MSGALVPDSGVIRFKGTAIAGLKPHRITRMGIARTFQSVKVFSKMSVLENVLLGYLFGRAKPSVVSDAARREAEEILDFVRALRIERSPCHGSDPREPEEARGGQGPRPPRPDLLLLDEVMAGLTPTEVAQSMELVKRIRDRGVTVFMIEHVMKAIMSICDRIIVLHHGEKIAEGTPPGDRYRIER